LIIIQIIDNYSNNSSRWQTLDIALSLE